MQWRIQDFPEEGAPTPQGGAPTYEIAKFSEKLHEIERIWTPRGGARPSRPPLDPPMTCMSPSNSPCSCFKIVVTSEVPLCTQGLA